MHKFLALIFLALCLDIANAAPPKPSAAFQEAFERHTRRVLEGNKDIAPLLGDLRQIALSGDPVAQFMLASLIGTTEPEAAISLLQESYKGGCVGAAGTLGALVGAKNLVEAQSWFIRAANEGDGPSQLVVAGLNERGKGFARSKAAAVAWAKLARSQTYNRGVARAADEYLANLEPTPTSAETAEAEQMWALLQRDHPKQPAYLCGQSAP
jgi:TPR repeat protein